MKMITKSEFKRNETETIRVNWERVKLSDVVRINPKRELAKGTASKKVSMDTLVPFTKKIRHFEVATFAGGSKFRNGDTLLARITPCLENGKTAFVDILQDDEVGHGSTEFIVLCGKEGKTTNAFVYYLAMAPGLRREAIKSMTGTSGRQRVQTDSFGEIEIACPPLEEQHRITQILSDLDSKIELNHQMNIALEAIGQTIYKRWFIDFEFPNKQGKPYRSSDGEMVYNGELGREIPRGWEVSALADFISVLETGSRPKGGVKDIEEGIPSVGAESITRIAEFDFSATKFVSVDFFEAMNRGRVENGDILLYKDGGKPGEHPGKKTMIDSDFPFDKFCINEHVYRLRVRPPLTQHYLYFWLDTPFATDQIIQRATGVAQPGLNRDAVEGLPVLVPTSQLVPRFTTMVKPLCDRMFENGKESRSLALIRDALLPKLMSGRIRVPVEVR